MNLGALATQIQSLDAGLKTAAGRAVNRMLTIRNWLIGYYIVQYEQHGEDRAKYGSGLLAQLEKKLSIRGLTAPELSRCRQFYSTYPEILGTLSQDLPQLPRSRIFGLATQELR